MDLDNTPVEDIEVTKVTSPSPKVGGEEFCKTLGEEFSSGKIWRSSKAIAAKLNVDIVELDNYLRKQQIVCSRPSKEEGVFLYALVSRLEPEQKAAAKTLIEEVDRYALASLHAAFLLLEATLQKYALKIHDRNAEAFTQLAAGKEKIEAGIVLYAQRLKADMSKLPKVER